MIRFIFKILKIGILIILFLAVLFLAQCMYSEMSQRDNLQRLCVSITPGSDISGILAEAEKFRGFEVRSEALRSTRERDWFNRQYDGFLETFRKNNDTATSLTIIFAKPGIGYYACIIEHDGELAKVARYLDRSD